MQLSYSFYLLKIKRTHYEMERCLNYSLGYIITFWWWIIYSKRISSNRVRSLDWRSIIFRNFFKLTISNSFIITGVNFLTEMTSNMATTAMLLPVMIPIANIMQINPFLLLVGATLAASCAFMLPVATPPNAVVFGSKLLKISDMIKVGILINIFSIIIILIMVYFGMPIIWNLS